MKDYRAPPWLPGGNLQTIWPALFAKRTRGPTPQYQRERWNTPDGDFLDLDWQVAPHPPGAPLLVMFHGLEGSSRSHYAEAFADYAASREMGYVVPHFRGCSGEINLAPRAYHSGDFQEVGWILERLRTRHAGPLLAVGVSLGGNALMRWAGEMGESARNIVDACASICSPIDLYAGGIASGKGFNRMVYTSMFMRSLKPKALRMLAQHPGLFDREALLAARDLYEFDNAFTAPVHGFRDADDYWTQSSAKPHLSRIRVPALVLNALNDPFVPKFCLPHQGEVGEHVTLWQPKHGGHVGFPSGPWPSNVWKLPEQVVGWLVENKDTGNDVAVSTDFATL